MTPILVTGCAGFIGMHVCRQLLDRGQKVIGLDNLNDYYDPRLKEARLKELKRHPEFIFYRTSLQDAPGLEILFKAESPRQVINLAAQAGVRYSLEAPGVYVESNLLGFAALLEACRHHEVAHLVFASSSSVYGLSSKVPFREDDPTDRPVSLYAATKKSNELMAHSYSHLFRIPCTGLRFFTAYGPWGRPDMAPFLFTKAILGGKPIQVFNSGKLKRDFTYIDDIVKGVSQILVHPPATPEASAPFDIYNIGNNQPIDLMDFIKTLEKIIGKKAILENKPMQAGDVLETFADTKKLQDKIGFKPSTKLETGLTEFVKWYRGYYGV